MSGPGAESDPALLTLHAVRVLGVADAHRVADRFGLDRADVAELLLDDEARGWVARVPGQVPPTWALTPTGRQEGERRLAHELDQLGARAEVAAAYRQFSELNGRLLTACTNWQIRPTAWDPLARNEHDDWLWDERVLDELARLAGRLRPIAHRLTAVLRRFDGYADRFARAVQKVERGDRAWVDEPGIDSCHQVWFQLHEDLIATLGIDRGDEPA